MSGFKNVSGMKREQSGSKDKDEGQGKYQKERMNCNSCPNRT